MAAENFISVALSVRNYEEGTVETKHTYLDLLPEIGESIVVEDKVYRVQERIWFGARIRVNDVALMLDYLGEWRGLLDWRVGGNGS